ncbi:MAG: hypothetical protein QOE05_1573 [Actinomycetota bacterium]|jgi:hypothetical protein|nr:hypothetical protein [Actinomycetota bacterium]
MPSPVRRGAFAAGTGAGEGDGEGLGDALGDGRGDGLGDADGDAGGVGVGAVELPEHAVTAASSATPARVERMCSRT